MLVDRDDSFCLPSLLNIDVDCRVPYISDVSLESREEMLEGGWAADCPIFVLSASGNSGFAFLSSAFSVCLTSLDFSVCLTSLSFFNFFTFFDIDFFSSRAFTSISPALHLCCTNFINFSLSVS